MTRISLLIVFVASGLLSAECSIPEVLSTLRPGAVWSVRGNTYEGIVWQDQAQQKPGRAEVANALTACATDSASRETLRRIARYQVRLSTATATEKIDALILLLDLDRQ